MSEAVCTPMAQGFSANVRLRGGSLCLSVSPLSCQCGAATCGHVHRWRGQNLWLTVSWVPLEIFSVTPDFWPHLYPHYSFKTPHTWQELDPLMPAPFPSSVSACACMSDSEAFMVPPHDNIEIRLKTSQLRLLSSWPPFQACSCAAVERWPANYFVLRCWLSLGQRARSLLEGLRGDDDICTARQRDKSRTNGMLYKTLNCLYFHKGENH